MTPSSSRDTRDHLIARAGRPFAPVPNIFIQTPGKGGSKPGPLAKFVTNKDKRGLLAFLFLHTIISNGDRDDGWSTTLDLRVWARALDTTEHAELASASSAATKILSRLVKRNLITRRRSGRQRAVTVTLLKGDGTTDKYERPSGKTQEDRFLRLNNEFWHDDWNHKLDLPAIAMLLVALKEKPTFSLATDHTAGWYGWSPDTAAKGFKQLRDTGLLEVTQEKYANPLSPIGVSTKNIYRLLPPFDRASIDKAKAAHTRSRKGTTAPQKRVNQ